MVTAIGFNVETVTYKNIKFQVWDLGGQTSIRPYWRCYYPNTQAIIYVVDSSDTERIGTSRDEFHAILEEDELKNALILVYANKQVNLGSQDMAASAWRIQAASWPPANCQVYVAHKWQMEAAKIKKVWVPCHLTGAFVKPQTSFCSERLMYLFWPLPESFLTDVARKAGKVLIACASPRGMANRPRLRLL